MATVLLKNKWREAWVCWMLVGLMAGLLVSRALVSFTSVLIVLPFFFGNQQPFTQRKLLAAIWLLLMPVLLSGLWSSDSASWWNSVAVRLPLLTMFLGLSSVTISQRNKTRLVYLYLFLICLGCAWSLSQYLADTTAMHEAYLRAKTLPTPSDDDHIRFSWMVVVATLLGTHLVFTEQKQRTRSWILAAIVFLVVYLHLLAAKTGLVGLYTGIGLYVVHSVFIRKQWRRALAIVATGIAMAAICYLTLPTLRNRIQYVVYDLSNYAKGNTMPGYTDASRLWSMKAGYQLTLQHPLLGVGFGDMRSAVDQWHTVHHPESPDYERFLPANEWLVYGTGSGIPGSICFTIGFLALLYFTTRRTILSVILSVTAILPFLFDDTLEGQTGVIVLAFIAFFGQQKLAETPVTHE